MKSTQETRPTETETPQARQIQARQNAYSYCLDLLIEVANDYAELVGVKGFSLCSSYSRTAETVCFLENHEQENMGSILESQNEQAIAVFLGMIAQAKATPKKGQ